MFQFHRASTSLDSSVYQKITDAKGIITSNRVELNLVIESGMPSKIASTPAREKFKSDVTEMMVDARQRLKAFSTLHSGARPGRAEVKAMRVPAKMLAKAVMDQSNVEDAC